MRRAVTSVLELDSRRRIADAVRANPGIHLRGLADLLQMPVSTLEYHCHVLQKGGHLATRATGKFKAFFVPDGIDRRDKDILYVVRHDAPRRICRHLLDHPGSTPGELCAVVQLSAPTLSFHIKKMRNANLLREERDWRQKRLFVEDPERVAEVLASLRDMPARPARPARRPAPPMEAPPIVALAPAQEPPSAMAEGIGVGPI
ncbi:MAG: hypothetical protein QOD77_2130 [Thermoplasmata archaeon]|jgi:predicted transcriptional regulator|nr:hypothetical protein [Thermoplasmata archaeon]